MCLETSGKQPLWPALSPAFEKARGVSHSAPQPLRLEPKTLVQWKLKGNTVRRNRIHNRFNSACTANDKLIHTRTHSHTHSHTTAVSNIWQCKLEAFKILSKYETSYKHNLAFF